MPLVQSVGLAARRGTTSDAAEAELIVNATPLGMGASGLLPLDPLQLSPGQIVNDLVYHPLETPLLRAARASGATCVSGVGMLIHQAGLQFELWTGQVAPLGAMRAAADAELQRRELAAKTS